ncbi:MAG TPA: hypothetical protein VF928_06130 [Usitatibacteraceae bacterium]
MRQAAALIPAKDRGALGEYKKNSVIPAKAGIQSFVYSNIWTDWAPACAGTTKFYLTRIANPSIGAVFEAFLPQTPHQCWSLAFHFSQNKAATFCRRIPAEPMPPIKTTQEK